jgi:hypothetical protein
VLSACAALSILLHAALLPLLREGASSGAAGEGSTPFRGAAIVARLLPPSGLKTAVGLSGASGAHALTPDPSAGAPARRDNPPSPRHETGPGPQEQAARPGSTPESADSASHAVVDDALSEPEYIPSSRLTRSPRPTAPVDLSFPRHWSSLGRYRAHFALYVDEQGVVQRVERVEGDFPPPLETVVRQTFMGVLFTPGELDGRPVRARMTIEVTFDAESTAPQR